jgi:DNA mismatch endonuclease (patch repair protein)
VADVYDKAKRSEIMASIKGKNTSPERALAAVLQHLGLNPQRHRSDLPGSPDLVLPRRKIAIFINGCFWHGHKNCPRAALPSTNRKFWAEKIGRNKRRDAYQKRLLRKAGWGVLTFWTCKPINELTVSLRLKLIGLRHHRSKLKARA